MEPLILFGKAVPPPVVWVGISLVAYVLAVNVLWATRRWRFRHTLAGRVWVQMGRFAFYVGIPYLALGGWPRPPFRGDLAPADMGLVGLNAEWPPPRWLEAAGRGVELGVVSLIVLALAWYGARRIPGGQALRFPYRPWWVVAVGVLYAQVHRAFYWGAMALAGGSLALGILFGVALVFLEWSLNPSWRQGWQEAKTASEQWLQAAMVLVAALLFFLTYNFWVCLVVHLTLESVLRRWGSVALQLPPRQGYG